MQTKLVEDQVALENEVALESRVVSKVTKRLIPFLFLCFAISILDRVNIGFAALQMNADLGFSSSVYGLGAGIFFFGYFLLEVPGGALMTKYGARKWISRIMISWGLVSAFTAFVTTPTEFYIVRFLLGVSEASFFPCMAWYLSSWFQSKHHARAIAGFMVAIPTASAIGAPISTHLLTWNLWGLHGWQTLFIVEAIPSVILGIIVLYYLTDSIESAAWLNREEKSWLLRVLSKEQQQKKKKISFMQALKDKDVLMLSAGYFGWMCGYYGIVMFLPILIKEVSTTITLNATGWIIGGMYLISAIGMVLVGRSSDRMQERKFHVAACLIVSAIGLTLSVYSSGSNVMLAMLFYTISLAGAYGAYSPFWSIPPQYLSGTAAAAGIALINSVGNLGGFLGPYVMGHISSITGAHHTGILFLAACMIVSATLITIFVHRMEKAPD